MKVFLSWSGDRSSKVARALSDWLPGVSLLRELAGEGKISRRKS